MPANFTVGDAWQIISALFLLMFGAGVLVERHRNGKYLRKDVFSEIMKQYDEKLAHMSEKIDKIAAWVERQSG